MACMSCGSNPINFGSNPKSYNGSKTLSSAKTSKLPKGWNVGGGFGTPKVRMSFSKQKK